MKLLIKKILKKARLFCFVAIAAITNSNTLLPMQPGFVDLKINQRPENMSTYEWSVQKAAQLAKEKRLKILKSIGATEQEWETAKKNYEPGYKIIMGQKEAIYKKNLLPQNLQNLVMNVIERPSVKEELGITRISKINGIIIAERENKTPIKFLCDSPNNPLICAEAVYGYNVILSPTRIFKNKDFNAMHDELNNGLLEAFVGHELGHIKYKHQPEENCLRNLYNKKLTERKVSIDNATFENILADWKKATEVQADIFGTFDDRTLLESAENYWTERSSSGVCETGNLHPQYPVRANYLNQMHSAIKKEPTKPEKNINKKFNKDDVKKAAEQRHSTSNPQKNNKAAEFMKNFIKNITAKKVLVVCGVVVAAYIILK
jgi:hypothetical protein